MFRNYLTIALRNIWKNKTYSSINILGLAAGMGVAMLIALWMYDELNFNGYFDNREQLVQLFQHSQQNESITTHPSMPVPIAAELREKYPEFKEVCLSSWEFEHIVAHGENKFVRRGLFAQPNFPKMFSLKMLAGVQNGLQDVHSIMVCRSLAQTFFGTADPIGKIIRLDNKVDLKVSGVFEDFPQNASFNEVHYLTTWELYKNDQPFVKAAETAWGNCSFQCFAQIHATTQLAGLQQKLKNLLMEHTTDDEQAAKQELFLHPMPRWHLYGEFKDGKNVGGRIQFVWMFGIVGAFVLFLACINFMNLSTARSEKRAKEVGIRKAIGSYRSQLVRQFLSESFLMATAGFFLAILLVAAALPWFNELANKALKMPWDKPAFWLLNLAFISLTGLLAGSYPALYLSSFAPIKVLKGTFRAHTMAAFMRKGLVVVQFTVSVALIIGTLIVHRQIQFTKDRPVGFEREGLFYVMINTPEIRSKHDVLQRELLNTGVVSSMSMSTSPMTDLWSRNIGFNWEGKDPNSVPVFATVACTHDHAQTVGMKFMQGRNFSRAFKTDTSALVINEAAAKIIGEKDIVGKTILWNEGKFQVIGVVEDMLMESPFEPVAPAIFVLSYQEGNLYNVKLKVGEGVHSALEKVGKVFTKLDPGAPFDYKFIDQEYDRKFAAESRLGKLANFFAFLAIFISCLGLFGLASFVAEQRTKEIGIRKVLGASVGNLWGMLSKDFVVLVLISCALAAPLAYYFLEEWLEKYTYRIGISWTFFAYASMGAVLITLLTVSYQAIRAALLNPVKSLKSE
jgi:predicted permease